MISYTANILILNLGFQNLPYVNIFLIFTTNVKLSWPLMSDEHDSLKINILFLSFNGHFSPWTWVSQYQNVFILDCYWR